MAVKLCILFELSSQSDPLSASQWMWTLKFVMIL